MSIDLRLVSRPPKSCCVFVAGLCAVAPFSQQSYARRGGSSARLNENTLTVVSRSPNGSPMPIACDRSAVRDANLAAVLPGRKRFEGAEDLLPAHAQVERGNFDQLFDEYLAATQPQPAALPQGERDRLFQEFLQ
jgi:hypothetical protein